MKRIAAFLFAASLFVGLPAAAQTPATVKLCVPTSGTACPSVTAAAPLPVTGSFTPSGTQNVNLTQILGAAPSLTNPLWVFPATGSTFPVVGNQTNGAAGVVTALNIPAMAYNYVSPDSGATWAAAAGLVVGTAGFPAIQVVTAQDIAGMIKLLPVGTTNFAATQVSVTTGATVLSAARTGAQGTGRKTVCVTQTGTTIVYLGGSGVTTSTGDYLAGAAGTGKCFETQAAIYGIVGSGTQTVSVTETY